MSSAILDLIYGNSFKPGLTPSSIPIGATSYLDGVNVSGNNFSFSASGDYQLEVYIDSDFSGSDGSRIEISLFNVTKNAHQGRQFILDANSGEASWIFPFTVTDVNDQYTLQAVTFSNQPGTIKAVRMFATGLGGGGGGAPDNGPYVLATADALLPDARVLTAGSGISITDNGAGGTIVIAATGGAGVETATLPLIITGSNIALGTATGPTTADVNSSATWSPSGAASKALVLQAKPSQSQPIFEIQRSNGSVVSQIWIGSATYSGLRNTNFGTSAGSVLTNGNDNTFLGFQSGLATSTGIQNTAIGSNAGAAMASVDDNTMVGYNAGLTNTSAQNTFIGSRAGETHLAGTGLVYVGYQAGLLATGIDNTIVGHQAGDGVTSGSRNAIFGRSAGGAAAAGSMSDTVLIGYQAGLLNTANQNVFIGSAAGDANTASSGQVFIGYQAGGAATGASNTIIGYEAGDGFTTGAQNTIIGRNAGGQPGSGAMSDTVMIGYNAGAGNSGNQNVFIGSTCGDSNASGTGQCFVGYAAGTEVSGSNNTIFGHQAGDSFTTGARNCLFGKDAGGAAGATSMSDTVMMGYQAGLLNTANENTYVGSGSGATNASGQENVFVGYQAGNLSTGGGCTLIGYRAGYRISSGGNNVFVGGNTGAATSTMNNCTFIGTASGNLNSANQNTFVGSAAGQSNTSGTGQCFVGYTSGNLATGNNNTLLGHTSGSTLTTGTDNVLIGFNCQVSTNSFSQSIGLGSGCSVTASNQFVAGSSGSPTTDVYFGKGVVNASATAYTINGTGGSGTDNAGANLQLAGGKGTGTAEPGLVVLKYPLKTTTGTTLQSLSTQSFPVNTTMFTANLASVTVDANVVNTTETTWFGTLTAGSRSIEGGMLRIGRAIRLTAYCSITTSATPVTMRIRAYKGTSNFFDTGVITPAANLSGRAFYLNITGNVRTLGASGTIAGLGFIQFGSTSLLAEMHNGSAIGTINTTTTEDVNITITYGGNTAGNSLTIGNIVGEILN